MLVVLLISVHGLRNEVLRAAQNNEMSVGAWI